MYMEVDCLAIDSEDAICTFNKRHIQIILLSEGLFK